MGRTNGVPMTHPTAARVGKERPILFSAPMVRALLDGSKTQTRRIVKLPSTPDHLGSWEPTTLGGEGVRDDRGDVVPEFAAVWHTRTGQVLACPYGIPGDRLWVRETWRTHERESDGADGVQFAADDDFVMIEDSRKAADDWIDAHENGKHGTKWRPSIFMPRWAARLPLEVTGVRVERLQDISEADAKAEGVAPFPHDPEGDCWTDGTHRTAFNFLWNEINGWSPNSWDSNPWVWVVSFARVGLGEG